uniref:Uncharacterized protein n=1 Tax=Rangifer tarandus platyrhynchus TaxID=3082113 RepID=A0ACB0DZW6_RANTA|nr:unnamed protein product [Rangifer tarandus platyrhynchus]
MHHCPRAEPRAGNGAGTHPAARRGMPMRIYRARGRRPRPRAPRTAAAWRSPPWALATGRGRGQGGRLAGLGAMAKPQSLSGPGEEGRVDARLRGTPSAVLLLSWVDLEARKAAPEPACLNLSLARCSLVLRLQQSASPPRAPSSPPVKPASKHSLVLGP